jgi:hypothetical protein
MARSAALRTGFSLRQGYGDNPPAAWKDDRAGLEGEPALPGEVAHLGAYRKTRVILFNAQRPTSNVQHPSGKKQREFLAQRSVGRWKLIVGCRFLIVSFIVSLID